MSATYRYFQVVDKSTLRKVIINNPKKKNALNSDAYQELTGMDYWLPAGQWLVWLVDMACGHIFLMKYYNSNMTNRYTANSSRR